MLQGLEAGFVVAVAAGKGWITVAPRREAFFALELTAGIDFVAVGSGVAEKYLKGLEKNKLSEVSLGKKTINRHRQTHTRGMKKRAEVN